ncbi:threonine ammonia-lyase [Catenuloplanes japonicus]|uniref:threonine ammonia-lyase n=1 Tax=Catenuloplanes japonicus TaxID=33876 RepID=UPI0005249D77|nr:pyridoxal-phosphate dependent enzyme [Catenuloplanes japonicus]
MTDIAQQNTLGFDDIQTAATIVAAHLPPTPMWEYPQLSDVVGARLHIKHENTQPTGAFKVRGALNLLGRMNPAGLARGVVTYSTGNHALAIAYAAREFGAPCTVVMPEAANPSKVRAVRALKAEVALHGVNMADMERHATTLSAGNGFTLVSPGDTPELIAGVGSAYLEALHQLPAADAIVVPVGAGTGAAAACLVAAQLAPACRVIGVQSSSAPAAHDSWRARDLLHRPNETTVEGLATGRGFAVPQSVLRDHLADFLLVTDEEIGAARRLLATHAHTLAEGAGAAALAGILRHPDRFTGQTIIVMCTGGNAGPTELATLG